MPEPIESRLSDPKPTKGALAVQFSQARVDSIFRELAIRHTTGIGDAVAGMLASKMEEVVRTHPELSNMEVYIVAARLLKQLISCYQSELNGLLP